ncbi:MAG: site-2 protease family protein [Deltaproteobacteria bacterium]|nr:site-2 protease family protein [Deltaproteobacteria bacterium]
MTARQLLPYIISLPPFLLAITVHEVAHGYIAYRKGDHTARLMGRITLNPIRHLDPIGSVLFPLILAMSGTGIIFGWAKPVPVNSFNFKSPRKDMVSVSLAGPASNLLLAMVFAFLFRIMLWFPGANAVWNSPVLGPLAGMLIVGIKISIYLGVFNLLPIHPLDGSHILEGLLPAQQAMAYSRMASYGWIILLALLFTGVLNQIIVPFYRVIYLMIRAIFGI